MTNISRIKCEDIGFEHYWEDVTPPYVPLTFPAQIPSPIPSPQRKCKNCGLIQIEEVIQPEIKEWRVLRSEDDN